MLSVSRPAMHLVAFLFAGLWGLGAAASIAATADGAPDALDAAQLLDRVRPMESRFVGWPWSLFADGAQRELHRGEVSELARVVAAIETKARTRDDADAAAALGRLRAVQGNWDEAAAALRLATVIRPDCADIHSDYAAVLVYQGSTDDDPTRLLLAIQELDRALDLDGAVVEARFNRAIALSLLGITELATSSWEGYIAQESEESWRAEATTRLESLDIVTLAEQWDEDRVQLAAGGWRDVEALDRWADQDVEKLFELVLFELLPRWARAIVAGERDAEREELEAAEHVAEAIDRIAHDALLIDALRQAQEWDAGDRQELLHLAHAIIDLGSSALGLEPETCASRGNVLEETIRRLERIGSPLRFPARRAFITCVLTADAEDAVRRIEVLSTESSNTRYEILRAQMTSMRALAATIQNQLEVAIGLYRSALSLAGSRMPRVEARQRGHVGYLAERLGRHAEAWDAHVRALRNSNLLGDPVARDLVLQEVELFVHHNGYQRLSTEIAETMALRSRLEVDQLYWQLRVVVGKMALGDEEAAGDAERPAARLLDENRDSEWDHFRNRLEEARALRLVDTDPGAALAAVEKTKTARTPGSPETLDVSLVEARALRRLGRRDEAEQRLQSVLEGLDTRHPAGDVERESFLSRHRGFYEAIVELLVDTPGAELSALAWIDWFKHRNFAAHADDAFPQYRARLEERIGGIPSSTVVIAWAVLPERLVVWRIDQQGLRLSKRSYANHELQELVRRYRVARELRAADDLLQSLGSELYSELIEPAEPIVAGSRLILVPDLFLHEVPFSTLARGDGSRLGQIFELALTPSLGASGMPQAAIGRARSSLLSLGAAADSGRVRGLADLPLATEEARLVATFVAGSTLLAGEDATIERFLALAPQAEMLHVAAHMLSYSETGDRSGLLLTASGADDGILSGSRVAGLQLHDVRLVYLSSCGVAVATQPRIVLRQTVPEIPLSFLRAGAHLVTASLSPLSDAQAMRQAATFYRLLTLGWTMERSLSAASGETADAQIWVHPTWLVGFR